VAVPWFRRLVAGLSPRRPGFDPGSVRMGFVVDNVALGQVFSPSTSGFPCKFHSTGSPLKSSSQWCTISLQGCGASVAHLLRCHSIIIITTTKLTSWSAVILQNVIFPQLPKKFPAFYGTEGSLQCRQEPWFSERSL
jgi:hypothetical protein